MKAYTLVGVDGNAFSIMGYVTSAMRKAKMSREEINEYTKEAMRSDYNNLLVVSCEMIDKVNEMLGLEEDDYDEEYYEEDYD